MGVSCLCGLVDVCANKFTVLMGTHDMLILSTSVTNGNMRKLGNHAAYFHTVDIQHN